MSMFGGDRPDPRDVLLKGLQDEIAWLRQRLEERDKQILALTDAAAFRMLHPHDEPPPAQPLRTAVEERNVPYKPQLTLGQVKEQFGGES